MPTGSRAYPTPLRNILNNPCSGQLQALVKHVYMLQRLDDRLNQCLPPLLKSHCKVGDIRDDVLVLNVTSPVWATRLRYLTPSILAFMQRQCALATLRTIRVRVSIPPEPVPAPKQTTRPRMSIKSADYLKSTAQSINDPALRSVLLRLSDR
jgi:hypothetical protein